MGDREIAECLYERLRAECRGDETMGELETLVDRGTREARRLVLERLTRDAAVRQELGCPQCGSAMRVVNRSRPRTVESAVGAVRFARDYGRCPDCGTHAYPADEALGLHGAAHASPRLQELCALTALRAPAGRAEEDVRRLAGRDVAASTLHREARRQGGRALAIRGRDAALSETPEGRACLAARAPVLPEHSTPIIGIDAWNIRERDCWGETRERREAGEDVGRWHSCLHRDGLPPGPAGDDRRRPVGRRRPGLCRHPRGARRLQAAAVRGGAPARAPPGRDDPGPRRRRRLDLESRRRPVPPGPAAGRPVPCERASLGPRGRAARERHARGRGLSSVPTFHGSKGARTARWT